MRQSLKTRLSSYQENLQRGRKSFLRLFVSSLSSTHVIPLKQQKVIDTCFSDIESGEMDSVTFELIIYQLACEFDEHMIVWKIASNLQINQLFDRGPVFVYLISLPDIKTCSTEIVRLKDLILEPSYSIRFYEAQQMMVVEVTEIIEGSLSSHLKFDIALVLILYIFRQVTHQNFDYDTIYVPDNRPHFDSKALSFSTKARVTHHNGPMLANFPINLVNAKNSFYVREFSTQLKVQANDLLALFLTQLPLSERIIKYLLSVENPAAQTISMLASSFGMSQATFRRYLAKENTSFKQIRNRSLESIYLKLLLTSDIKIEDLALKLGYSGRSTFERSFCAKFGIRPVKYRKLHAFTMMPAVRKN